VPCHHAIRPKVGKRATIEAVPDYYGELGVSPDATATELRRAYRERARQLHPDLHPPTPGGNGAADAMRRLNEAWRVLGDPRSRRRYDAGLSVGGRVDERGSEDDPATWPGVATRHRLRPSWWVVAVAILAAIFIITAYAAGPVPVNHTPGSGRPPEDHCLARFPGYEAFVPCSQPNIGRVVSEYAGTGSRPSCPAGTVIHQVLGRDDVVCLDAGG
jgi:hypothetical protein